MRYDLYTIGLGTLVSPPVAKKILVTVCCEAYHTSLLMMICQDVGGDGHD
jgi:hypothetical protein